MKNILFLEHLPYIGGGQRVLLDIVEGIKNDYNIRVVLPAEGSLLSELEKIDVSYDVVSIGNYNRTHKNITDVVKYVKQTLKFAVTICQIIKKHEIDLVYANGTLTFFGGVCACVFTQTPIIFHLHGVWSDRKSTALVKLLSKMDIVKRVISVSYIVKNQLEASDKNVVIYNSVDIEKFKPSQNSDIKARLQIPPNHHTVGIISSLIPEKGHEDFIKAAKIVTHQIQDVVFLIVGDIPDKSEQIYKDSLYNIVSQLSLKDKIIFTGYRPDIPQILSVLDVLVVASTIPEACPVVLVEASASGVPAVASRLGGSIELVKDGVNGFLYDASKPEYLASKILTILQDDALADKLGKQARAIAEERFDKRKFVQRIKREIDLVI